MAMYSAQVGHTSPTRPLFRLYRCLTERSSGQLILLSWMMLCRSTSAQDDQLQFTNVTADWKLDFQHYSPLTPERHLHLFMGSGLAWIDHDRDDWPDLFFCQGAAFPTVETVKPEHSDQLFRNRNGSFENITELAGLRNFDYSMGTAVGDYDNDGFQDLYVSSYGPNHLYKNNGDGTWSEIADQPVLNDKRFGASCTWADVDADGDLDLYVANYLQLPPNDYPLCSHDEGGKRYPGGCHPRFQKHEYDILFRNDGEGTFADISQEAGLMSETPRAGLGVFVFDTDEDRDLDFYIANDTVHNQLWVNSGRGTFVDDALVTGVAVNGFGVAEAGMGVNGGDIDGDGRIDLFVTNYFNETNTLYRNDGIAFTDVTAEYGLGAPSKQRLGFGTTFIDVNNDGWLDIFVANGHVQSYPPELERHTPFAQLPQLFLNRNGQRFEEISLNAGSYFMTKVVGRSSGMADFDRDGRSDLAILHLNDSAAILRNDSESNNHSVTIELIGTRTDREAIGAFIDAKLGDRRIVRLCNGSVSYLASDERRTQIGIGEQKILDRVTVRWPSGLTESWRSLGINGVHKLIEGRGDAE
ncbi:MAG: CRTAC1 family protein [Planctomycetaceae bacterium]